MKSINPSTLTPRMEINLLRPRGYEEERGIGMGILVEWMEDWAGASWNEMLMGGWDVDSGYRENAKILEFKCLIDNDAQIKK